MEPVTAERSPAQEIPGPPADELPAPPPPSRWAGVKRVWAVVGIVVGFLFYVVPGVFALRSYRRWRRGAVPKPLFAWGTAWVGVPLLVLGAAVYLGLYGLPLVSDDFSDETSGWPQESQLDWTAGYHEGAYRILLHGSAPSFSGLVWSEGPRPNVAVEADVFLASGDPSVAEIGVMCVSRGVGGYVFSIGPGSSFKIEGYGPGAPTWMVIAEGELPEGTGLGEEPHRIRGECRAGSGPAKVTMYVDGTKVAEADVTGLGPTSFDSIGLFARAHGDPPPNVDARFDDALAIAVEPDSRPPSDP